VHVVDGGGYASRSKVVSFLAERFELEVLEPLEQLLPRDDLEPAAYVPYP